MDREIFGSIETVRIPSLDIEVIAKVDTGAWSGALHCIDIYEKDGRLHFTPLGDLAKRTSTDTYKRRAVRSASGDEQTRYIIPVTLEVKGKSYLTAIGLWNRETMQREMLLGRKFLIENNVLVDVMLTIDDDYEAEKYL